VTVEEDIPGTPVLRRSPLVMKATIDASELALFSRDLGGTKTDVLVAAAGRALAAHTGGPWGDFKQRVGVAVPTDGGAVVAVVRNAAIAPLPMVRSEVGRLIEAARAGLLDESDVGDAAMIVECSELGRTDIAVTGNVSGCCVLGATPTADGDPRLDLTLTVEREALESAEAEHLLALIVRLLQQPYRRLV
jgi:2-oxoacid dehydrogenases acyltransferase (catalytic domain)